jgi:hypothetical protein
MVNLITGYVIENTLIDKSGITYPKASRVTDDLVLVTRPSEDDSDIFHCIRQYN